jgi:hypothetical protein
LYVSVVSSWDAAYSRNWRHFSMVASVREACLDARVLRGVSIVLLTARANNKNTPVTSWMNFFLTLSNKEILLIGFANCSFVLYFFLMQG